MATTKNKIIKEWSYSPFNKQSAARQRQFGVKARAQRSDAGKKRKP